MNNYYYDELHFSKFAVFHFRTWLNWMLPGMKKDIKKNLKHLSMLWILTAIMDSIGILLLKSWTCEIKVFRMAIFICYATLYWSISHTETSLESFVPELVVRHKDKLHIPLATSQLAPPSERFTVKCLKTEPARELSHPNHRQTATKLCNGNVYFKCNFFSHSLSFSGSSR